MIIMLCNLNFLLTQWQDVAPLYGVFSYTPDANRQMSMFSSCSDQTVLVIQQVLRNVYCRSLETSFLT
jgi:hypothetical protein